jgi:hypothetical protein
VGRASTGGHQQRIPEGPSGCPKIAQHIPIKSVPWHCSKKSRSGILALISTLRGKRSQDARIQHLGLGFDLDPSSRLSGLGLVGALAQQLGGSFSVERTPGARCTVRFPDQSMIPCDACRHLPA